MTLDDAVRDICYSVGNGSLEPYPYMLRIAMRAIEDMNHTLLIGVKQRTDEISSSLTISCPNDCREVYRVALVNEDRTITLLERQEIVTYDDCDCCECSGGNTDIPACDRWQLDYECSDEIKNACQWGYDSRTNKIYFQPGMYINEGYKVVYTYKSSIIEYEIDSKFYPILRNYVLWQYFETRPGGDANYFRRMLIMSIRNMKSADANRYSKLDLINAWLS